MTLEKGLSIACWEKSEDFPVKAIDKPFFTGSRMILLLFISQKGDSNGHHAQ
ncbi:hypothetical protein CCP4SC76_7690003 [Gammaproteobacteria bacterium]